MGNTYDQQLILQFLCDPVSDDVIRKNTMALNEKATQNWNTSGYASLPIKGMRAKGVNEAIASDASTKLAALTSQSRLYLIGHGDWQNQTLGDRGPEETAAELAGLGLKAVNRISILGCALGRDRGSTDLSRVLGSIDSFASKFHIGLKWKHNIATIVLARVYWVAIWDGKGDYEGRKGIYLNDDENSPVTWMKQDRWQTKLKFSWNGNAQQREWAY